MEKTTEQLIREINTRQSAEIRRSSDLRPRMNLRLIIALDVAATDQNPFVISNPFNGFFVEGATAATTQVNIALGAADGYATDNKIGLRINAAAKFDSEVKGAYLTWTAQPGQLLTINFFTGIDFRPGSTVNSFTGAVSVLGGSSVVTGTMGSLGVSPSVTVGMSATQLCPVNAARSELAMYTDSKIWIGDAAVAINRGFPIAAGSSFTWNNTGVLFAVTESGTGTVYGMEQRQ